MTPRTILRDSAASLPVVTLFAGWVGGAEAAAGTLASGLVAFANLAVFAWLVDRLTRALGAGHGAAMGIFVGLKSLAVLGAVALLLATWPAQWVALGIAGVMSGFALAGLRAAWRTADVERESDLAAAQES